MSRVECAVTDGVAVVTMNSPQVMNALDAETLRALQDTLHEVAQDAAVRVLVITGAGKAFVAGADIKAMQELTPAAAEALAELGHATMNQLESLPMPVIAAVNGFALGGGLELALSADFIYVAEEAKVGLPELKLGLIPGFGGHRRLSARIGLARAKEMIFTGKLLRGTEARDWGLANAVFPAADFMEHVMATAKAIQHVSPHAVQESKKVLAGPQDDGMHRDEITAFGQIFAHPDAVEGKNAFVEKRQPVWQA